MGLYDTMNQPAIQPGQAVNGTSAQKSPVMNSKGKQPIQGRGMSPASSGQNNVQRGVQSGFSQPNQMQRAAQSVGKSYMQPKPVSNSMMQQKQLMLQNKINQAPGGNGTIGGSFGQLIGANPALQNARDTGMRAGQDMSWMDRPGALNLPNGYGRPDVVRPDVQSGLAALQTPYDMQQAPPQMNPMQALEQAQEQMRGYEGSDLGSQDPRELARVSGGIGPSNPMQAMQMMDENGLELRRGAR